MKALAFATLSVLLCGCSLTGVDSSSVSAASPDGRNEIRLLLAPLSFEVLRDGKVVVARTEISIDVNGRRLDGEGVKPEVVCERLEGEVKTPVYKKAAVSLEGNETYACFGEWGVRLVARDDGVAYRFETRFPGRIRVNGERAGFVVPDEDATCHVHFTKLTGYEETQCSTLPANAVKTGDEKKRIIYAPFLFRTAGVTVAAMESDVRDYPICDFTAECGANGSLAVKGVFPGWPKSEFRTAGSSSKNDAIPSGGRKIVVDEHEGWLVETAGERTFPWRAFAIADKPADLFGNDLVYALAPRATGDDDFAWVKPGKVAWDWWNAFDNKGVEDGCTTETYNRFVDFAADNGIEYVIMDEGWSENLDIWKFNPKVDVPGVIERANEKGVGIILWMAWAQVVGEEDRVAEHFARMGAKGFKVDFMDRGDAEAERFLWRFAESCRKNKMLVDYHGVHHPAGLNSAYPNVLNFEGVHGLEQMKWYRRGTGIVENDVKICFTRMTAGPMDYTPGAMDNYAIGQYPSLDKKTEKVKGRPYAYIHPGSLGTRSRQMAMLALYEAPLQMLCDSPTKYERSKNCISFMSAIPTTWDDTIGLGGTPDTFAAAARRKGGVWYAAGITNVDSRDFEIDTSFLADGEWKMELFCDRTGEKDEPSMFQIVHGTVHRGDKVPVRMAAAGGFIARFYK